MAEKKYFYTIGLEIHAELKTQTKMFCACKNDPDEEEPNKNICPVCMAHPGALPVPNKKAIENVIKVGLAIEGAIADFSEFDRKNYFYPDIPKGYQISQYKFPIVSGGHLADFDVTRIHLEEDTANNKHDRGDFSLIDFNRAGVPLMELVTEPHTFSSAEEAAKKATKFAKEFQLILWYLDVSEANMEKGEMRVEANISITEDPKVFGTKVEVKNLNSFRSVERAIKYEALRMEKLFADGKASEIVQETRGWDESKQATFSQRKKESSHDYRYFPDPDLPKMKLHEAFDLEKMKTDLPELPEEKRKKLFKTGAQEEAIEIYIQNKELDDFYHGATGPSGPSGFSEEEKDKNKLKSNYITSVLAGSTLPNVENFNQVIDLVAQNQLSATAAKSLLSQLPDKKVSVLAVAKEYNFLQKNDPSELRGIAQKIIDANPKVVADYKGGKENALMSLVGQMMKETKGSANPQVAKKLLEELIK